ncbi:hypothetical protein G6F37_000195 [Rhizopus arrhizus]|nr:hypothetical protein G6F38_001067 [Rhizopus arrhizus]KAG1164531.1 hypothetical protein G6F37_000195 [Rhizopus arrhizus]
MFFCRELKYRAKWPQCAVVNTNEFRVSQICNNYKELNVIQFKLAGEKYINSILDCKNYRTLWNRDVNTSKNILDISSFVWRGETRPKTFAKEIVVEKMIPPSPTI